MARRAVSVITTLKLKVPPNAKLLVAVSGGKDSVALLDGLVRVSRLLELKLEVAHVDHGLRIASKQDAVFVENICKAYKLVLHQEVLTAPEVAINIENWGRKQRYTFFRHLLDQRQLDYIVTAHHSNDVAETFLMRLVSNKELRSIHAKNKRHHILRPLLGLSRPKIDEYVAHYKLEFREDETNASTKYLRNKVRHELLPLIEEKFHPRCAQWIAERALALDDDSRCLDLLARRALKGMEGEDFGSRAWQELLRLQPIPLGIRAIEFELLLRLGFRLGRARARLVRRVVLRQVESCHLPQGWSLKWQQKELMLLAPNKSAEKP